MKKYLPILIIVLFTIFCGFAVWINYHYKKSNQDNNRKAIQKATPNKTKENFAKIEPLILEMSQVLANVYLGLDQATSENEFLELVDKNKIDSFVKKFLDITSKLDTTSAEKKVLDQFVIKTTNFKKPFTKLSSEVKLSLLPKDDRRVLCFHSGDSLVEDRGWTDNNQNRILIIELFHKALFEFQQSVDGVESFYNEKIKVLLPTICKIKISELNIIISQEAMKYAYDGTVIPGDVETFFIFGLLEEKLTTSQELQKHKLSDVKVAWTFYPLKITPPVEQSVNVGSNVSHKDDIQIYCPYSKDMKLILLLAEEDISNDALFDISTINIYPGMVEDIDESMNYGSTIKSKIKCNLTK